MKRVSFTILLILLITIICNAQLIPNLGHQKAGTSSLQFLKIGQGARAAGMGETFVSVVDDISALYYNPAGLTLFKEDGIIVNHTEWFVDTRMEFFGGVYHFGGNNALGLSITALTTPDMKVTTELQPFGTGEYFRYSDIAIGLSYARQMTDQFSFGATVKYVEETLADLKMRTVVADLGTYYRTGLGTTRFSVVISNFGAQVSPTGSVDLISGNKVSSFQKFPPPTLFKIGFAFEPLLTETNRITTSIQLNSPNDNAENFSLGGEYSYKEMFFLRAGYKFNVDSENFSAGVGVRVPVSFARLNFDYAISNYRILGLAHRISLNLMLPKK